MMFEISKKVETILYVEDEEYAREILVEFLSDYCNNILVATNGKEGLELFKKNNVQIIISDIGMPQKNGIEMIKEIREINEKVRVIFTTAFNDFDYLKSALDLHADGYFIKPFFFNKIQKKLQQTINDVLNEEELIKQEKKLKEQKRFADIQRDRAVASEKAKSEFLANMSHEIRTPLNAILGFVDLMKDEDLGTKVDNYVDIIDRSGQVLLKVLEDVLDFSKIESGKLSIEKIFFNPKEEFETLFYLFSANYSQKNISLELDLDDSLPNSLKSDPLRIKQVISNLLSNAYKFSEEGTRVMMRISYQNNLLSVSVEDEGKGISPDKIENIFDEFTQEDSSTTRNYGGTGLGLTISSKLVALLAGELKVKSKINEGSTFYFSIPVDIAHKEEVKDKTIQYKTYSDKKILIVEDNEFSQELMKVLVEKFQLQYEIACTGREAVEMYKVKKYDLVLMDENMPVMNGTEATKEIRSLENAKQRTPIIALTANAIKGDDKKFLNSGMDLYITKPINKKKLSKVLNQFLE